MEPVARGNGIGHNLLRQVENEVRDRGGRLLLIETSSTLPYALARQLYESTGYTCDAVVHDFYAPRDDLLIYAKTLGRVESEQHAAQKSHRTATTTTIGLPVALSH